MTTHLDTLKAMRDAYAQLEEPNRLAALDAAIAAMEQLHLTVMDAANMEAERNDAVEQNAALGAEIERLKVWSSDSHVTELEERLARVRAAVEALPMLANVWVTDDAQEVAISRAAVLALLEET